MNNCLGRIVFLTVIAGRTHKDTLLDSLSEAGGRLINVVYGRCPAKNQYLQDMLGLAPGACKVMITCLLPWEKTDATLEMLKTRFHFDRPNTGTAFTIPVECFSS